MLKASMIISFWDINKYFVMSVFFLMIFICFSVVAVCFFPVNVSKYTSVLVNLFIHGLVFVFLLLVVV